MRTLTFVYGAILGEMFLMHADNLNSTPQHKSMSAAEGQQVALMTVQSVNSIRTEELFDLFDLKVNSFIEDHDFSKSELPRQRKQPRQYEGGSHDWDFHETLKEYF